MIAFPKNPNLNDQFSAAGKTWIYNGNAWQAAGGSSSYNDLTDKPVLATVATTGSYNDLLNKPTIVGQVNSDWNATSGTAQILNKPTLATVATSGSYTDLSNKPTIPTQVNSDWNATSGSAQILNKPTLGTAAATNATDYATAAQGAKADTASQPGHTHALGNITQSSATSGQVPTWNGTAWVPQTPSSGVTSVAGKTGAVTLAIGDLTQSSATSGQVPTWSGTAWVPQTPSSGVTSVAGKTGAVTLAIADVTSLQTSLDAKISKNSADVSPVSTIRCMTQTEYDALGSYDPQTLYFIK